MLLKIIVCSFLLSATFPTQAAWLAGAARVNITPNYPVRLAGYGSRTKLSEGVKVEIWAKAIAIAWDAQPPSVIITVDNCGVPGSLRDEVLAMLRPQGIDSARLAINSSHTHCAPALRGALRNLFPSEMTPEHLATVDRYTNELRDALAKVARDALADMLPSRLQLGYGSVAFAMNRRLPTPNGPVNQPYPQGPTDHDLPVLKITRLDGKVRAIFTSYACHCTTMSWNFIHPDWAGIAQLHMEMAYSKDGAIALTAIGCGADQNPFPRRTEDDVRIHGYDLAHEAVRVGNSTVLTDLHGPLRCDIKTLALDLEPPPGHDDLAQLASTKTGQTQRHAQHFLGMLDQHQNLPNNVPYIMQNWAFGSDLDMIMLAGEVVVDYGLRLKRELDPKRLWVNSYSNDMPCYIPSERVLKEGGYEGAGAMIYYLRPSKFAPGVEDKIIGALREMVPAEFVNKKPKNGNK